jgi:hypothetical protein
MKKEFEACDKELIVSYEETPELKDKVFERVMQFFKTTEHFSGESIMQSDDAYEKAPEVLSDIADNIIKFNTTWRE